MRQKPELIPSSFVLEAPVVDTLLAVKSWSVVFVVVVFVIAVVIDVRLFDVFDVSLYGVELRYVVDLAVNGASLMMEIF